MNRRYLIIGGVAAFAVYVLFNRDPETCPLGEDFSSTFLIFLGGFGLLAFFTS